MSKDNAVRLLYHYLTYREPDLDHSDTHAEVSQIVDEIVDAACDEMDKRLNQRLQSHTNFVNASKRVGRKKP